MFFEHVKKARRFCAGFFVAALTAVPAAAQHPAELPESGLSGFVPLLLAVQNPKTNIYTIAPVIERDADVNARDDRGRSVLMLAAMYNPDPAVSYWLIENGADVNAKTPDTGWTPLFFAARYNANPDVVALLINNKSDRNAADIFGKTPYDYLRRNPKLKNHHVAVLFDRYRPEDDEEEDGADASPDPEKEKAER